MCKNVNFKVEADFVRSLSTLLSKDKDVGKYLFHT